MLIHPRHSRIQPMVVSETLCRTKKDNNTDYHFLSTYNRPETVSGHFTAIILLL